MRDDLIELLKSEFVALWAAILVGIGVGLAGAYARELNEGRSPNYKWFRNRLLIYPFLSLAAAAAAESTNLSRTQAAFLAAILSLLSFDAVRLITERFKKRAQGVVDLVDPQPPTDHAMSAGELLSGPPNPPSDAG